MSAPTSQIQIDNAFLENEDPTLHLYNFKSRPTPHFPRWKLVDGDGKEYWFAQKEPKKLSNAVVLQLGEALLTILYMRWRAAFDKVEITVPGVCVHNKCPQTGKDQEQLHTDTFEVRSFAKDLYNAEEIALRIPLLKGVFRNRHIDNETKMSFARTLDMSGRILDLTFHPEENEEVDNFDVKAAMQQLADTFRDNVGVYLDSVEWVNPTTYTRTNYKPQYAPR